MRYEQSDEKQQQILRPSYPTAWGPRRAGSQDDMAVGIASFRDSEIIRAAKSVYQSMANSNPWLMGKNQACYFSLHQITSIYRKLSE